MTKHPIDMLSVSVSRRQVMTGAAGLTFAIALSRTSRLPAFRVARCKARA